MERTTQRHQTETHDHPPAREERLPIWANTRPRANAELDRADLNRGVERLEAVVGR
jgi:hypothetical protein